MAEMQVPRVFRSVPENSQLKKQEEKHVSWVENKLFDLCINTDTPVFHPEAASYTQRARLKLFSTSQSLGTEAGGDFKIGTDATKSSNISMSGSAIALGSEGGLPPKPLPEQGWEAQPCLI